MNSLLFYTVSEQPSFRIVQNVAKIPTSSIRKSEKTSSINNMEIPRIRSEWHDCYSDDRREEESFANRIYPLMGHDVIQKGFALKNLLPTACPCWAQRSISLQVSILYEISHLRSRWHCCHSERSVSREKNLSQTESTIAIIANKKRIPRRLIASLGMTRGYRPWNTHHLNSEKSLA